MSFRITDLFRPLLGKLTWRKDPSSKVIYITFDDGPVPEVTLNVLDILDTYRVKATFFCVGENVEKYPEVYAELLRRMHCVGNHTYNHLKGFDVSTSLYVENVQCAAKLIDSKLFRPPHGRFTFWQRKKLATDYELVMWDVLTRDYNRQLSPETIMKIIKTKTRNGSIVVFHDSIKAQENMLSVLPQAIEWWKNEGYEFGLL